MVRYRSFRNTDPPLLTEAWNEAMAGRGSVRLGNSSPLERCVFAKPYFDPAGLIVGEEDGACVGLAHAGFGTNEAQTGLSYASGVTCVVAVRPAYRRRGIGSELLRRCEDYLRQRGAQTLYAGPHYPLDPFYHGLYGGSELPGFLDSDSAAAPFLAKHGYSPGRSTRVWHRVLQQPIKTLDPRVITYRQRFELQVDTPRASSLTWWQHCVLGLTEPLQFLLVDKGKGGVSARALVYELEGFSWRWGQPAVGLLGLEVRQDLRRQALAKFFLAQILRYVQDQCFELVEVQAEEANEPAAKLFQALGFTQVDLGRVYQRQP